MILAHIPYHGASLPVEILDVYESSIYRCQVARVRAMRGEPFPAWTTGGFAYDAIRTVPAALLSDVHQDPEPAPAVLDTIPLEVRA